MAALDKSGANSFSYGTRKMLGDKQERGAPTITVTFSVAWVLSSSMRMFLLAVMPSTGCLRGTGGSRRKWMIPSLQERGGSKSNKYHPGQQCPNENNRLPGDENEKSHTETPGTKRGKQLRIIIGRQLIS